MSDSTLSTARRLRAERRQDGRTQEQRSEATIVQLIAAARTLFASKGFAETTTEDIIRAAGVSRGALYHHFSSKTDVFRAVFEEQQQQLASDLGRVAAAKRGDAWTRLEAGSLAFLDACLDPAVAQIFLIDGFAALGWDEMRAIEHRYTLAGITMGIELAMREGVIERRPVEPLAQVLFGALCELAMTIARAGDPARMTREVRREVRRIFAALRV